MEKAYQLHFKPECAGGLSVNFCGVSKTQPLHSFGPAVKPHYIIHYVLDGKGRFSQNGKEYPLEKDYGFRPSTSLREGLGNFAKWYKEFYCSDEIPSTQSELQTFAIPTFRRKKAKGF